MRNARSSRSRQRRPVLEPLDDRCLLTTATLTGGVLTIVGTEAADQIVLNFSSSRWARAGTLNVVGVGRISLRRVSGILIGAGGGDDLVFINTNGRSPMPVPIWADGGAGNDVIAGGKAREVFFGNDDNDIILSRGGFDLIDPGTGFNWVNGQIIDVPVTPPPPQQEPVAPAATPPPPVSNAAPAPVFPASQPSNGMPDLAAWSQQIIDLTNQQRRQNGLPDLAVNPKLMQAAQIQADQMTKLDRMQHDLPGAQYPDLASRARAVGYNFAWFGENIAYNYPDPEGVMQGWMLSSGHRANILNPDYTEMGAAVAFNAQGRPYFAQVFGRPA